MTFKIHDLPRQPWRMCPTCGTLQDGLTSVSEDDDVKPTDGSLLICWYCAEWGVLDVEVVGSWRKPTEEEVIEAYGYEPFVKMLTAVRMMTHRERS